MSDRSQLISRLLRERDFRAAYIRAKLDVLIPSQLRALRLRQDKTQPELARMTDMLQSRISAMETPGRVNFNLETLVRMAATHNVGMVVKFVPFSEMLEWENEYNQDGFKVVQLANDINFLQPGRTVRRRARRKRNSGRMTGVRIAQTPVTWAVMSANSYMNPVQQGRPQMRFQFESSEQPTTQRQVGDLITLPKRNDSVLDEMFLHAAAAGAGAGGNYARQANG